MFARLPRSPLSLWSGRILMPPATMVAAVALLATLPGTVAAQTPDDSVGVRALVEAYRTTWDRHDASALGMFFTPDADMIMGTDPVAGGRTAIQGWWRGYFERQEPEREIAIDVETFRFITPDVAVLNATTTTGGRSAQGEQLRARRARGTWVVVRDGGTWRIATMRGMPTEQDQIIRRSGDPTRHREATRTR